MSSPKVPEFQYKKSSRSGAEVLHSIAFSIENSGKSGEIRAHLRSESRLGLRLRSCSWPRRYFPKVPEFPPENAIECRTSAPDLLDFCTEIQEVWGKTGHNAPTGRRDCLHSGVINGRRCGGDGVGVGGDGVGGGGAAGCGGGGAE